MQRRLTPTLHRTAATAFMRRPSASAALCALLAVPSAVQAQTPTPARTPASIQHTVTPGDTLEQLARRYLGEATLWQQLQAHNQVANPYRLRPGAVLEIPLRWLRSASASVDYVQGTASLRRASYTSAAAPVALTPGLPLQEGDQLELAPQAFVTVRLADGSTVRVQAQSQLQLTQLRRRGRAGSLQSVLDLQQGGLDIQVPGQPDATRRLEVVTPVAATSVRGTQFSVQLDDSGRTSAALYTGKLSIQGAAGDTPEPATLLAAGYGVAVSPHGHIAQPTPLLPAPDTAQLPTLQEDAQWLQLPLPTLAGAQAWHVLVSEDAAGQRVLRNGQFAPGVARFAAVPDGAYHLQVRAIDAQGIHGVAAQVPLRVKAHPVAPLTQSPAPQSMLAQGEAQLLCTPVDGVQLYRLQVVALADASSPAPAHFDAPMLDAESHAQCQFDLRSLPSGRYSWRVASIRQLDAGVRNAGPFSVPQVFTVAARPAAPLADALQTRSLAGVEQIFWPGEAGQRYRLQAFATADGTQPALDTLLTEPQWTASGLPPGTWHVRIQVQDPSGLHSAFSPPRSVQVRPLVRDSAGNALSTGTGLGVEHPSY